MGLREKVTAKKPMTRMDLRVPRELKSYYNAVAKHMGVTVSDVARAALEECKPKLEDEFNAAA